MSAARERLRAAIDGRVAARVVSTRASTEEEIGRRVVEKAREALAAREAALDVAISVAGGQVAEAVSASGEVHLRALAKSLPRAERDAAASRLEIAEEALKRLTARRADAEAAVAQAAREARAAALGVLEEEAVRWAAELREIRERHLAVWARLLAVGKLPVGDLAGRGLRAPVLVAHEQFPPQFPGHRSPEVVALERMRAWLGKLADDPDAKLE